MIDPVPDTWSKKTLIDRLNSLSIYARELASIMQSFLRPLFPQLVELVIKNCQRAYLNNNASNIIFSGLHSNINLFNPRKQSNVCISEEQCEIFLDMCCCSGTNSAYHARSPINTAPPNNKDIVLQLN